MCFAFICTRRARAQAPTPANDTPAKCKSAQMTRCSVSPVLGDDSWTRLKDDDPRSPKRCAESFASNAAPTLLQAGETTAGALPTPWQLRFSLPPCTSLRGHGSRPSSTVQPATVSPRLRAPISPLVNEEYERSLQHPTKVNHPASSEVRAVLRDPVLVDLRKSKSSLEQRSLMSIRSNSCPITTSRSQSTFSRFSRALPASPSRLLLNEGTQRRFKDEVRLTVSSSCTHLPNGHFNFRTLDHASEPRSPWSLQSRHSTQSGHSTSTTSSVCCAPTPEPRQPAAECQPIDFVKDIVVKLSTCLHTTDALEETHCHEARSLSRHV